MNTNKITAKFLKDTIAIVNNEMYDFEWQVRAHLQKALREFVIELQEGVHILEEQFNTYESGYLRANNNRLVLEGWVDSMTPLVTEWRKLKAEMSDLGLPLTFDETLPERYKTILKNYNGR